MRILNTSKNTTLAENCRVADNFFSRFLGLMGKRQLPGDSGLIITPCNSIHMFFMRFPLDIIFIDKKGTVLYTIEGIKPWRVSRIIRFSHSVIELPAGTIYKSRTIAGDQVQTVERQLKDS